MMLCKADFEELFPELFSPERQLDQTTVTYAPGFVSLARWEDDGGRLGEQPHETACPNVDV